MYVLEEETIRPAEEHLVNRFCKLVDIKYEYARSDLLNSVEGGKEKGVQQ